MFQSVYDAANAMLNHGNVKVQKEPQPLVCEPEVGQKLLLVHGGKRFDTLDFDDHFGANDEISSKTYGQLHVLIDNGNLSFPLHRQASVFQLESERQLVNTL